MKCRDTGSCCGLAAQELIRESGTSSGWWSVLLLSKALQWPLKNSRLGDWVIVSGVAVSGVAL